MEAVCHAVLAHEFLLIRSEKIHLGRFQQVTRVGMRMCKTFALRAFCFGICAWKLGFKAFDTKVVLLHSSMLKHNAVVYTWEAEQVSAFSWRMKCWLSIAFSYLPEKFQHSLEGRVAGCRQHFLHFAEQFLYFLEGRVAGCRQHFLHLLNSFSIFLKDELLVVESILCI